MAWEWVGTAAVGIAGIFGTWLNGKQARDDARTLAGDALAHQRLLADDARRQQRLENAYVNVLEMAERASQWAQIAYPLMDSNPPAPVPDLPSLDSQSHVASLVGAYGSDEVLSLLEVWREIIHQMLTCDRLIKMGLEHEREAGEENPRITFMKQKTKECEAREALRKRVSIELGHRDPGWASDQQSATPTA